MSDFTKTIQLYNLSTDAILAEMPYVPDVEFMEGDELEMPDVGAFKIVRRRWSITHDHIALVLVLAPLG